MYLTGSLKIQEGTVSVETQWNQKVTISVLYVVVI